MLRIGNVTLETNLWLAPIAGYCDLAFRLAVRKLGGVGLAFTELLSSQAIQRGKAQTMWRAVTSPDDQPLGIQIYGRDPDALAQAARWAEQRGATLIDINMGCPIGKVTKRDGGSKLLCEPQLAVDIARRVVRAVNVPVTAKIRLGWDQSQLITDSLPPALADVGIAAVIVHGRTTQQKFSGAVQLDGIAQVVESVARQHGDVPVIGNGDVQTPQDAKHMIDATGCAGVMIGRGALGQPWIFRDTAHYLSTGRLPPTISQSERTRIMLEHFETVVRLRGEHVALNMIRQRIRWYSPYLQPWPGLRRAVHHMKTADQFRQFVADPRK